MWVPNEIEPQLPMVVICPTFFGGLVKGPSPFLSHFSTPSLIFPKITSQINHLHLIPYFRVSF